MISLWPTPYIFITQLSTLLHGSASSHFKYQLTQLFHYSDDKQFASVGMDINTAKDWSTVSRLKQ